MKRVLDPQLQLQQKEQKSLGSLSYPIQNSQFQKQKPNYSIINDNFTNKSSKYDIYSKAPYYDPFKIHVHRWVKGIPEFIQSSDDPTYNTNSQNKEYISKNKNNEYCSICHELNLLNIPLSNTNITSISSIDKLENTILKENQGTFKNSEIYINKFIDNLSKEKKSNQEIQKEFNKDSLIFMKENEYDDYVII